MVYLDILKQQRKWLLNKNKLHERLDEDIIRKHLQHVDLEEEKLKFICSTLPHNKLIIKLARLRVNVFCLL